MRENNLGLSDRDLEREGYALPSKLIREQTLEMLKRYKGASVLLYLAGNGRNEYQNLPYDLVVTTNYDFNHTYPVINGKLLKLPFENRLTMRLMIKAGLKVDCLVAINDGDFEGGNIGGCINTEDGFSQLMPLLKDECLYITDHFYGNDYFIRGRGRYQRNPVKFLNVPFESELLTENPFPIPLRTLSDNIVSVFKLIRMGKNKISGFLGSIKLGVQHDSIWSNWKKLDGIFVPEMNPLVFRNYCHAKSGAAHPKISFIHDSGRDIENIIQCAEENAWKRIGLVPFAKGKYLPVMNMLRSYSGTVQEIDLFHLHEGDYSVIYSTLGRENYGCNRTK